MSDSNSDKRQAANPDLEMIADFMALIERERSLISLDIHDGLIQELVAAKMMVEAAQTSSLPSEESDPDSPPSASQDKLEIAKQQLQRAIEEARRLMNRLQPLTLNEHGLVLATEQLISQFQSEADLKVEFIVEGEPTTLPESTAGNLFRIIQESLNNVRKHAQAKSVVVKILYADDTVSLTISDDGIGFDIDQVDGKRVGLRGIKQRCLLSHGRVEIHSELGSGTRLQVDAPIPS